MKKILFLYVLVLSVTFSESVFATSKGTDYENKTSTNEITTEQISSSPKLTSNASIGFSTNNKYNGDSATIVHGDTGETTKYTNRLPYTGETVGWSLSTLGLLLIIIFFRKKQKKYD